MRSWIPLVGLSLLGSGCTLVGPDYTRPDIETPGDYRYAQAVTPESTELVNSAWWDQFGDPVLSRLIETALRNNRDVHLAVERVQEFAARVDITRAGLAPQVGYRGEAGRSKVNGAGGSLVSNSFASSLNVGWELDAWGRIARAGEADLALLLAAEETRRSVAMSLVSTVATSYVQLLNLDEQLRITRQTIDGRQQSLHLFQMQFEGGVVSELEVAQGRSEVEQARIRVPQIEQQIALLENNLSILLGKPPGPIARGLKFTQLNLPGVPAGIPSDLLARRPDIRASEQQLVAANALIGVAQAQYFPTISLTGLFGFASDDLGQLLQGSSNVWGFGGGLLGPIFDGGRIDAEVQATESAQRQAIISYRQAILTALREVDDALIQYRKSVEILAAQQRQVQALRDYARFARLRYDEGQVSYIEVLDAERRLFDVELSAMAGRADVYLALVALYKALGGGWVELADSMANPPPNAEP